MSESVFELKNEYEEFALYLEKDGRTLLAVFSKPFSETITVSQALEVDSGAFVFSSVDITAMDCQDFLIKCQSLLLENKTKQETMGSTSAEGKTGFLFAKASVKVEGKVTSSRENTRSTNQTAKYQVRVNARQQVPTEGLSRLMDIMAQCTAPLPGSGSGTSSDNKEKPASKKSGDV